MHYFRVFFQACEFDIRIAHYALKWLPSHDPENGIIGRWITRLQGYKFLMIYIPGYHNFVENALSRLPVSVKFVGTLDDVKIEDHDLPNKVQLFVAFQSGKRDWSVLQIVAPLLFRLRAAVKNN